MSTVKVLFTINQYDYEGDCFDKGIFLHFGPASVKVADTFEEFEDFIKQLENMKTEMIENYPVPFKGK